MKKERVRSKALGVSVFRCVLAALLAAFIASFFWAGANEATATDASSVSLSSPHCLESDSGALDIGGVRGRAGRDVRVPVRIQHAPGQVTAFGFEVTYPEQMMEFSGFDPGDLAGPSTSFAVRLIAPARLSVTGASSEEDAIPKGASGGLICLNFRAKDDALVQEEEPESFGQGVGIPNPASVYCIENGGSLEIREDAQGNQYGVCLFSDGSECEEWAYFRGECNPVQNDRCYSLQIENLKDDLARFSVSHGCICVYNCQTEGDLNGDGNLTPEDALIAFRCYLKSGTCSDCADVNEDGRVTPVDALCIFKSSMGQPSCLDHQPEAAPAPVRMEGEWQSQNLSVSGSITGESFIGGSLIIDQEKRTVEMLDSPHCPDQGYLLNFHYTPTGGSAPLSFQAQFAAESYTACFTGTANNSLCPPGLWCIWEGRFLVEGTYSITDGLGQLMDEGAFSLKYPHY